MKRGFLLAVAALVVALGAGAYLFVANLGSVVKKVVETAGPEVIRVPVTLDTVVLSAMSGNGTLRGLTVGNPAGFKTDSAFKLGEVSVAVDLASVVSDVIVIREVVIAAPQVTYELGSDGSNIDAIQKNAEAFVAAHGGGGAGSAEKEAGGEEGPKVVIEHLYFRNGVINVSATILGGKAMSVPMPDLHLTDIGKKEGGATVAQVMDQILSAARQGIEKSVASLGVGKVMDTVKEGAAAATQAVEKNIKGIGGALNPAGAKDTLKKGLDDAGGALKKLFGK